MDLAMDQDLWLKALNFHGGHLLQTMLGDHEFLEPTNDAENEKQIMCTFIKDKIKMLFQINDKPPDKLPEHSIPIVPIEIFRDTSAVERRDLFYKTLDRGHILILRVINDTLPDNYKLLVLCKQENHMKLHDLSLTMFLPKLPAELNLAGGKLESNDLIRAAVCSCSIDERKLYVTLDRNILEDEADVYLGKITENDLPFYLRDVDLGPSYAEYLHNHTTYFNKSDWAEEIHTVLNIERNYLYSFKENLDGHQYVRDVYATELRKKQAKAVSKSYHDKGLKFYNEGNLKEAFLCFNKALSIFPKNAEALISRGALYGDTNFRKAFKDVETALNIEPDNERGLKEMSKLLVLVAKIHLDHKDLKKAQKSLDAALYVDSNNKAAVIALEGIRRMNISDKSPEKSDKSAKSSASVKKLRASSCSSDRSDSSSSRKDNSKEEQEGCSQSFNLEAATQKFLSRYMIEMGKNNNEEYLLPRYAQTVRTVSNIELL